MQEPEKVTLSPDAWSVIRPRAYPAHGARPGTASPRTFPLSLKGRGPAAPFPFNGNAFARSLPTFQPGVAGPELPPENGSASDWLEWASTCG
ncbi:MAG: hypothetical protein AB1758_26550 [Candidatus Eremiobacterota bacterium]